SQGRSLALVPYFWDDDLEMERPDPRWRLDRLALERNGLKVFNFHPIHVVLNSATREPYRALKRREPDITRFAPGETWSAVQLGDGVRVAFLEVLDYLASRPRSARIADIVEEWRVPTASGGVAGQTASAPILEWQ